MFPPPLSLAVPTIKTRTIYFKDLKNQLPEWQRNSKCNVNGRDFCKGNGKKMQENRNDFS